MTPAARWLTAHRTLAAHGIRLDGTDLTLEQAEAMAAIADQRPNPVPVSKATMRAVA